MTLLRFAARLRRTALGNKPSDLHSFDDYTELEKPTGDPNDNPEEQGGGQGGNQPQGQGGNQPQGQGGNQPQQDPEPQTRQPNPPQQDPDPNDGDGPSPMQALLTAEFEFENGMLDFNGERVAFDDLDPTEQAQVLQELIVQERSQAVLNELDDRELRVVNMLRDRNVSPQAIAEFLGAAGEGDAIAKLSDDEVNLRDIKRLLPNLTEEEQREELADRKALKRYAQNTEAIRNGLVAQAAESANQTQTQRQQTELNELVSSVAKLEDIDGSPLNDDLRDDLIAGIHEVNPTTGRSELDDLLRNPANKAKALFWLRFGGQLQEHYGKEVERLAAERVKELTGKGPTERHNNGHGGRGNRRQAQPEYVSRLGDSPYQN